MTSYVDVDGDGVPGTTAACRPAAAAAAAAAADDDDDDDDEAWMKMDDGSTEVELHPSHDLQTWR